MNFGIYTVLPSYGPQALSGQIVQAYTRWFKYDRDWFVCKQAALRNSCATLREWSHNLHPPSCSD